MRAGEQTTAVEVPGPPRRQPIAVRWAALTIVMVLGCLGFAALSPSGARAVASFAGGMLLTTLILEVSTFNVRYTDTFLPKLTLPVAVFSYFMSAAALAIALAASSPRVVDGPGAGIGLISALLIWLGTEIARLRVRS